jgi:hypothetical protein
MVGEEEKGRKLRIEDGAHLHESDGKRKKERVRERER